MRTAVEFLTTCGAIYSKADHGSYALKHSAERWGERNGLEGYVSNGALIAAALHLGFLVRPDDPRSLSMQWLGKVRPNARIGLSRKGLKAVMAEIEQARWVR